MSVKSSIIIRPILSEKGTMLGETLNQYVFEVEKQCNKLEIKDAIENKFKVNLKKHKTEIIKRKNQPQKPPLNRKRKKKKEIKPEEEK